MMKFEKYRCEMMSKIKKEARRAREDQTQEGVLGSKPNWVSSVAELIV